MRNNDLGLSALQYRESSPTSDWESTEETFTWEEYSQGEIRWHYQKVRARRSCRIKPANATEIRGAVRIPDVIIRGDGMQISVVEISDFAFIDCTGLTSLFIPSSIISIGTCAFSGCASLMEFKVGESNKRYITDKGVLYSKHKRRLIRYPAGRMGEYTAINGTQAIGAFAFADCEHLFAVHIPTSVTTIGESAFYRCCTIKEIALPPSIISIGGFAFSDCIRLTAIRLPDGITTLLHSTFYNCEALQEANIPHSVKSIESSVFYNCHSLTALQIPHGITTAGDFAFYGCRGLPSISIPSTLTSIGTRTFEECSGLQRFEVSPHSANYESTDGVLFSKGRRALICYPGGKAGAYTVPNCVTEIQYDAFASCRGLTTITIPRSVSKIDTGAFRGCDALREFSVDVDSAHYYSSQGVLYSKGKEELVCYPAGKYGPYEVAPTTVAIGDQGFCCCHQLTAINIPLGIERIGESAFFSCTGLTELNIPNSVKRIGEAAFYGCNGLKAITIPSSVTSIEEDAFGCCAELETLTILSGTVTIGMGAFSHCNKLKEVYWEAKFKGEVEETAFHGIASPATLYIDRDTRRIFQEGESFDDAIRQEDNDESWWAPFTQIVDSNAPRR
jgi:hypothetical protein